MAKRYIINALDIGSSFIKMVSLAKKMGEEDFEILGFEQEPSQAGVRRGVVIDIPKVSGIISSLVKRIEEKTENKINNIYTTLGGSHFVFIPSRGLVSVSRADQKISETDLERVLHAAETISLPSNNEILEIFPKEFIVDGQGGIKEKEVVGMNGLRLEAEVLILSCFSPYFKNSQKTIFGAGIKNIGHLMPDFLASAKGVLTPREKELGVCVLDIGAGTTGMLVFEEGSLIHGAVFPVGSGHITNDIAICFKLDVDTAERLKIEFGGCRGSFSGLKKERVSDKKIKIEGEESFVFSKKMLTNIIEARLFEIFDEVHKELKKISKHNKLPAGIVLTGGGAKIPGIKELAKKRLKLPCRIGVPLIKDGLKDPCLSALYGLVLEAVDLEEGEEKEERRKKGLFSLIKKGIQSLIP